MLRTHSPMHKQARILRGLAERLDDVEQDREVEGRVDVSRTVTEASVATASAEYDDYDINTLDFGWDAPGNLGWDMAIVREDPYNRYITLPGGEIRASATGTGEMHTRLTGSWSLSASPTGRAVTTSELTAESSAGFGLAFGTDFGGS